MMSQPPKRYEFEEAILKLFKNAEGENRSYLKIISGELHKLVGGYPASNHRMPMCCSVMEEMKESNDRIIRQPPLGNGASLEIEYMLPRRGNRTSQAELPWYKILRVDFSSSGQEIVKAFGQRVEEIDPDESKENQYRLLEALTRARVEGFKHKSDKKEMNDRQERKDNSRTGKGLTEEERKESDARKISREIIKRDAEEREDETGITARMRMKGEKEKREKKQWEKRFDKQWELKRQQIDQQKENEKKSKESEANKRNERWEKERQRTHGEKLRKRQEEVPAKSEKKTVMRSKDEIKRGKDVIKQRKDEVKRRKENLSSHKLFFTHCSELKNSDFEHSEETTTPDVLYTSERIKSFFEHAKSNDLQWAIFSDKYGFVFPSSLIQWYDLSPDHVSHEEVNKLLADSIGDLGNYKKIVYCAGKKPIHSTYEGLIRSMRSKGLIVVVEKL